MSSSNSVFPTGTFVDAGDATSAYQFNADMTWRYLVSGEVGAQGKYHVNANQWIEEGTDECPFPGTYEWAFDGDRLSFKLVSEDTCAPRRESTDGHTFILQK